MSAVYKNIYQHVKIMLRNILQLIPVLLFSYTGQVFMKRGSQVAGEISWSSLLEQPLSTLRPLVNLQIILGIFFAGIGAVLYIIVLSQTDLTTALPILGALGFLVLPIVGRVFLNEVIGYERLIGIIIIAIGMILVARS